MFIMPGITIASYVTGVPFTSEERLELIRYLMNHANEDGGWGMYASYRITVCILPHNAILVTLKGLPPHSEPP